MEALNGQHQFPAATAKLVVKFADAKPGAAARPGEKRPPGGDMAQVGTLPLLLLQMCRCRTSACPVSCLLWLSLLPAAGMLSLSSACSHREDALGTVHSYAAEPLNRFPCSALPWPQGPNKKAFNGGGPMGMGNPYGGPLAGLGFGALGINPLVRCCRLQL
jgi:hypothetical protein